MTRRTRVIPTLLLKDGKLVKGKRFSSHKYVGDPINTVRIFNDKAVDELILLNISATIQNKDPDLSQIAEIASEAFMPVAYGGGISKLEHADQILYSGIEKVILNSASLEKPSLISSIAQKYGSQSVIVSIDVKRSWLNRDFVYSFSRKRVRLRNPVDYAKQCEDFGAGEIMLTSVDKEGSYSGYDYEMIRNVSHAVSIPLIANGGAGSLNDFKNAIIHGASAVAAGSLFVFQRPHDAVLISYINSELI